MDSQGVQAKVIVFFEAPRVVTTRAPDGRAAAARVLDGRQARRTHHIRVCLPPCVCVSLSLFSL